MAIYSATNQSTAGTGTQLTVSTTYAALVTAGSSSSVFVRGKIFDVLIGTAGTPADLVTEYQLARVTTISTAVAGGQQVVASPADFGDRAAQAIVTNNSTGTGTNVVPNLWYVGVNCRASYRWVAAPGSEFVWPATTCAGITLQVKGTYTGTASGTILFSE